MGPTRAYPYGHGKGGAFAPPMNQNLSAISFFHLTNFLLFFAVWRCVLVSRLMLV